MYEKFYFTHNFICQKFWNVGVIWIVNEEFLFAVIEKIQLQCDLFIGEMQENSSFNSGILNKTEITV